jgi:PncC family amidohydrolase
MGSENLSKKIGVILSEKGMTLAGAESCTGGMVGSAITAVPGSSRYFAGGVIAYDNRIKKDLLKVPQNVLSKYGAVSGQAAIAMARGVQRLMRTDCAIAVSGVAGPGGGAKKKPVGLVYIAVAVRKRVRVFAYKFRGSRGEVRCKAVTQTLKLLSAMVKL